MTRFCSLNRCTRPATRVLVFDAEGPDSDLIRVRAEAYACDPHRDELAGRVHAYADTDTTILD